MLGHQGVALFERIGKCGLVGGSMSWWVDFEVSRTQARPSGFSLPAAFGSRCRTLNTMSIMCYLADNISKL